MLSLPSIGISLSLLQTTISWSSQVPYQVLIQNHISKKIQCNDILVKEKLINITLSNL